MRFHVRFSFEAALVQQRIVSIEDLKRFGVAFEERGAGEPPLILNAGSWPIGLCDVLLEEKPDIRPAMLRILKTMIGWPQTAPGLLQDRYPFGLYWQKSNSIQWTSVYNGLQALDMLLWMALSHNESHLVVSVHEGYMHVAFESQSDNTLRWPEKLWSEVVEAMTYFVEVGHAVKVSDSNLQLEVGDETKAAEVEVIDLYQGVMTEVRFEFHYRPSQGYSMEFEA